MILWKCTQYASKFGKLSSGNRTGKGQFSFQSQRKAMPKNAQTSAQLHSSHMLAKQCSAWTMNFQMSKLDLENAEEPEIKLPTSDGSLEKQERSRKRSTSALLTMPKPLSVWITTNWKILQEMGIPDHLTCLLRNLYVGQEAAELDMKQQTGSKSGKEYIKALYSCPAYLTCMQSTSCEMPGWMSTSWNQDCWEKYQ